MYHTEAVDSLEVKVGSDEKKCVTFSAIIGDVKEIELFSFYFDNDNNGYNHFKYGIRIAKFID